MKDYIRGIENDESRWKQLFLVDHLFNRLIDTRRNCSEEILVFKTFDRVEDGDYCQCHKVLPVAAAKTPLNQSYLRHLTEIPPTRAQIP